jgi:O-antigen ligase
LNIRVATFCLFFACLLASPLIVEPAYNGFLVAFFCLFILQSEWNGIPLNPVINVSATAFLTATAYVVILVTTLRHTPDLRDALRDFGAILAFFVGRFLFIAYRGKSLQLETLAALSLMGLIVSAYTIVAAFAAYSAGVSAYIWRGVYIPWAHTWLPYAIVANVFLASIEPEHARKWFARSAICFTATVASLSRTDLVLEIGFALGLAFHYRRQLLRFARIVKILAVLATLALLIPVLMQLTVVQQRLERGVGEGDQSLGWRFMENLALLDYFAKADTVDWLVGFGIGARLPLPPGIVDFNNNTSLPHLHNSFGTIALKFGILGLLLLSVYLWRLMHRSFAHNDVAGEPYRRAGRWIIVLVLGKALTLQGLSEWSHLVFFGIGCMLTQNYMRRSAGVDHVK